MPFGFRILVNKENILIEIYWGTPQVYQAPNCGSELSFHTIENVAYWLEHKWPVMDNAQLIAAKQVRAAMDCLVSVGSARAAFTQAAASAGFKTISS